MLRRHAVGHFSSTERTTLFGPRAARGFPASVQRPGLRNGRDRVVTSASRVELLNYSGELYFGPFFPRH